MDANLVQRRLELLGSSSGSIISVATWCSLHANMFDTIMECVAQRLTREDTPDTVRASLLYVLHEVLLNCALRDASRSARQTVLRSVGSVLPSAVQKVCALPESAGRAAFAAALTKVLGWWSALRIFPSSWVASLRDLVAAADQGEEHALPVTLQQTVDAIHRYGEAKRTLSQLRAAQSSDAADFEAAARQSLQGLWQLAERLDSSILLSWCRSEAATGPSSTSSYAGSSVVVKTEDDDFNVPAKKPKLESPPPSTLGAAAVAGRPVAVADTKPVEENSGGGGNERNDLDVNGNGGDDDDDDDGDDDDVLKSFY